MSVKRHFLLTCVMVGAATTVHSQGVSSTDTAPQKPAQLFGDTNALMPAVPARPAPAAIGDGPSLSSPISVSVKTAQPIPFVLEVAKPPPQRASPEADHANEVDISALRYFASQNDLARVSAEIRLLRSKHPDWEPPEDLFTEVRSGAEEQPLWDLFAKHDLVGLHAKMDEIRQGKPDWQPSTDLTNKLALAEAHDELVRASDGRQWGSVIELAAANKMLLTCGDIDALWRTAEALVHTADEPRAVEAYRYILSTCTNPGERLATAQKASVVLQTPGQLETILQMGKRRSDGTSEFEPVRLDLIRRKIGDASAGNPGTAPSQAELDLITASASTPDGKGDAQLLGWYAHSRKDFPQAEKWFRIALQAGPDAKSAEGLVLTLREGGKLPEAQNVALQYASLDQPNRKLMVELLSAGLNDAKATPLAADQRATLAKAIEDERSADGAQTYGWSLYKANDFRGADSWFRKSAEWQPSESAAIGLVVTAKRLKHDRDYASLIAKYRGTYPRIRELEALMRPRSLPASFREVRSATPKIIRVIRTVHRGHVVQTRVAMPAHGAWDKSADAIVRTYEEGNYDGAVAMIEQRKQQKGAEPRGLSIIRGWAMYHRGDWEGAKRVFSSLDEGGYNPGGQEGLRVIELGYTNPRFR